MNLSRPDVQEGPQIRSEDAGRAILPETNRIYVGDCLDIMKTWSDGFVQTCVTSPPYWGLRDYGVSGQIGLEQSPDEYVGKMVEVFREVRRVLRDDGTLWLNLGDSYASDTKGSGGPSEKQLSNAGSRYEMSQRLNHGLKSKNLVGIPWRVAFALQADGWYLRSDIIWAKPNPMPESVKDRPTKAHEYLFLMTKSERYFYDADAIKEKGCDEPGTHRGGQLVNACRNGNGDKFVSGQNHSGGIDSLLATGYRNRRSVWNISLKPFSEAHFATFPPDLIRPCILAGSRTNDVILDPFMGAGTTALVALEYNRRFIGCELNPTYSEMAEKRIAMELAQIKFAI